MALHKFIFFFTILILATLTEGLRVLVFFPMLSKSHSILGHGAVNHLLEAGHEVVHITTFPHGKSVSNLKEIDLSVVKNRIYNQAQGKYDGFKIKNMVGKDNGGDSLLFLYFTYDLHRQVLEEKIVVDFLSDPKEKFDVVVLEWFFTDAIAGIAPLFQCPLIWIKSTEAHWQILKIIDEIPNPSYSVDLFSLSRPPLSYWERIKELWMIFKKSVVINLFIIPFEKSLYNRVFPAIASKRGMTMPSYNKAVYNGSLLLLNSHPSIGTPYRLPQNAKYIAGYHIDEKVKPLPKVLQTLMDNSVNGVIYFSFGSYLRSADMSIEMKMSLIKMFGQLNQTVIWKYEEALPNVPSNVYLTQWAPQQSILAHPNLKIFVTHGGQLSTTEAVHYGVPVIGIPVLSDQHVNMKSVLNKGFGIKIKLAEDMVSNLKIAIEEMLRNATYQDRATQVSQMFHDRIVTPGKELVYWVQYVARTGGAAHLRSPALDVPFYQKIYLDLVILVFLVLFIILTSAKVLFRTCFYFKTLKEKVI